jgi:hypothetical protein
MASSGKLHRVALVKTDVSEDLSASIIRVTRIAELRTTLAVTNNRRTLPRNCISLEVYVSSYVSVVKHKTSYTLLYGAPFKRICILACGK